MVNIYTINPGEFRHKIEIKREGVITTNSSKIPKLGDKLLLICKAKIVNLSGKELILGDGINNINQKRFIIRYPKNIDITEKDIINYNNSRYNITYVSNIQEEGKYMEIVAEVIK